ncbi:MAG: NUDIX domain-containing protein [Planctomycetes bacterium]|nr:NUDIX domain-containing protein [Planctomycetota bacterium]
MKKVPPAGPAPGSGPASEPASPHEWVDLVDLENRILGKTTRAEVRSRNLLHRGVGILCLNSRGEVYVHRRTETKDVFPGLYDMFVGGVVVSGESYDEAARREIAEELGIRGPAPEFLFTHLYQGDRNRAWIHVYRAVWDGAIVHQKEEIAWGGWMPEEELPRWVERHSGIVPDGLEIFHHYLEWKKSR